jgi:hypothetical protein
VVFVLIVVVGDGGGGRKVAVGCSTKLGEALGVATRPQYLARLVYLF